MNALLDTVIERDLKNCINFIHRYYISKAQVSPLSKVALPHGQWGELDYTSSPTKGLVRRS
jgi:hypothetical protein